MSQTLARELASRTEAWAYQPKKCLKRPADPELVLRLKGESPPKRRCIRLLYVPIQADDLREQEQLKEEARLEQALRAKAQELADARTRAGGSGHPLTKTVPLERPEQAPIKEDDPPTDDARKKDKNFLEDLKATKKAWGKLDQEKLRYSYFGNHRQVRHCSKKLYVL